MEEVTMKSSGSIVFWSAAECVLADIATKLSVEGLKEFIPQPRTEKSALENALKMWGKEEYKGKVEDYRVLPLDRPGTNGYEFVEVERGEKRNAKRNLFSIKLDDNKDLEVTDGWQDLSDIRLKYKYFRGTVTTNEVGKVLVNMIKSLPLSTCLRGNGGIYWVSHKYIADFRRYADIVTDAAPGTIVSTGKWESTPETILQVQTEINEDIHEECAKIMDEIHDGQVHRVDFYENRAKRLDVLFKKVQETESVLDTSMEMTGANLSTVKKCVLKSMMTANTSPI